jgi:MFS family permease
MLTQTAFQPLYGRLSDLIGQKNLLFISMGIFALGSLLCGLAQNITWLIICRGLAGIGGGGIVACVWVITSQLVLPEKRAQWSQALSVTWCCSAVAGPLLGGVFSSSQHGLLSWRWGFLLNLPVCAIGGLVLFISLRNVVLTDTERPSWSNAFSKFDFIGLVLFMSGTCCIVIGFSFSTEIGCT